VYRVVDGLPVRHHRGEISVAESGDGAEVRWDVEYEFALPGLGPAARAVLLPQLGASLKKLAEVVAVAGGEPCGRCAPAPAEGALGPLRERAERVLAAQRALADRLEAADDPKRWFTRVYQYVTESQLRACDTGRVTHRAWVLHLVHRFHHYYADNLARWCGDAPGEPEAHWRSAFRAMEHAPRWYADPLTAVSYGLAKGVQAHIEEDLPRALAEVYRWHYASRCDYARLRADYLLMGGVFREASYQLLDRVPRRWFPLYLRVLGPRLPEEFKEALVTRRFYDVRRQRRKAFDRGERLAALMGRASAPSDERATIG
jgi:hypothetical protein